MLSVALLARWRHPKTRRVASKVVSTQVQMPRSFCSPSCCQQGAKHKLPRKGSVPLRHVASKVSTKAPNGGLLALCPVASKVSTQVKMPRTFSSLSSCQQGVNSSKNRGLFALLSRIASKVSTRAQNRGPLAPLRRFASKVSGFGRIRHLASKSSTHFFPRKTVPVSICQ